MLHQKIKEEIKSATLARDEVRLTVLRGLVAAFVNELVSKKRKPQDWLTDEEAMLVITRASRQRKDSMEQFRAGDREDLVKAEEAELAIIETYLPRMMDRGELENIVRQKIESMPEIDKSKMGMLIGILVKELKGKADGNMVKEVVEKFLS